MGRGGALTAADAGCGGCGWCGGCGGCGGCKGRELRARESSESISWRGIFPMLEKRKEPVGFACHQGPRVWDHGPTSALSAERRRQQRVPIPLHGGQGVGMVGSHLSPSSAKRRRQQRIPLSLRRGPRVRGPGATASHLSPSSAKRRRQQRLPFHSLGATGSGSQNHLSPLPRGKTAPAKTPPSLRRGATPTSAPSSRKDGASKESPFHSTGARGFGISPGAQSRAARGPAGSHACTAPG